MSCPLLNSTLVLTRYPDPKLIRFLLNIYVLSLERLRGVMQESTDLTKTMTAIRSDLNSGKINQSEYDFRITGRGLSLYITPPPPRRGMPYSLNAAAATYPTPPPHPTPVSPPSELKNALSLLQQRKNELSQLTSR